MVVNMKEILKKEKDMEKESSHQQMEKYMMVNGKIIKEKEQEHVFM